MTEILYLWKMFTMTSIFYNKFLLYLSNTVKWAFKCFDYLIPNTSPNYCNYLKKDIYS